MTDGKDTVVNIYLDNSLYGTDTLLDKFLIDSVGFEAFVGAERSAAATWTNKFNGYIYDLHIYTLVHDTVSLTTHSSSGCSSGCSILDMDQFDDSTPKSCTDSTCDDRSCVKSGTCTLVADCDSGSYPFCHLCADRECTRCSDYTTCDVGKCALSTFAQDDGSNGCECQPFYGREAGTNNLCEACHTDCERCDQGNLGNYGDCLQCSNGRFSLALAGSYLFCMTYCPNLFTEGTAPSCTPPSDYLLYHESFNTFIGPWGIADSSGGTRTYPAKERGQHFNGSASLMSFSDYQLQPSFTILAWIHLDDLTSEYAVYSKDRSQDVNGLVFKASITATDGYLKVEIADEDDSFATTGSAQSTTTNKCAANTWTHVGYSIEMQTNAKDTSVRLWRNSDAGESIAILDYIYTDGAVPYKSFLGAFRTDTTPTYSGHFKGFMYKFTIYNTSTSVGNPKDVNASCDALCSACTDTATECLESYAFTNYESGTCDTTTCNDLAIGCVRDRTCQSCTFDYCHLCYDRECTECSDYFVGQCLTGKCDYTSNASESGGECTCNPTYGRIDIDYICQTCHTNCNACTVGGVPDYNDCIECVAGSYNTSPSTYKYCTAYCPIAHTTGSGDTCTLPTDQLVLSYMFNAPLTSYENTGSAGVSYNVTPTRSNPSAHPAKDRGLYWDGTNQGYIEIPSLLLPHSFSVHTWVLMKGNYSDMTIFAKDRQYTHLLDCVVDASNSPKAELSLDTDASAQSTKSGTSTLVVDTWYYLVYSFEMVDGRDTNVELFVNNVSDETDTWSGVFLIDDASYGSYIGANRSGSATYGTIWNGYIYDFHLYVAKHLVSITTHSSVCTTSCSVLEFNEYAAATTCDSGTCTDRSCVKADTCQAVSDCEGGTFPFCHLCHDRECKQCSDYTTCDTNKCTQTGLAAESGGACACTSGNGRIPGVNDLCKPCKVPCLSCDVGALTDYRDCMDCAGTHYEYDLGDAAHFYCLNYCPTSYTGTHPSCVVPTDFTVYIHAFNTFEGPWVNNGITATATGVYPSKERGQYFTGADEYISFSPFTLRPSFSLMAWIRPDDLASDYTVFSKDRNVSIDTLVLNTYITATDGFLKVSLADVDDSFATAGDFTSTSPNVVVAQAWVLVGYSLDMTIDSYSTDIRLWINDEVGTTGNLAGYIYVDDISPYDSYLGAYKTDSGSFDGDYKGFMYKVYIFNEIVTGSPGKSAVTCDASCTSSACTDTATECLESYEFTEYSSGNACLNCTDISCVRGTDCQTCSESDFCHLCYDRECVNCTYYFEGDCQASSCTFSGKGEDDGVNTGQCVCSLGKGRSD